VAGTREFGRLLTQNGASVVAADRGCSAGHQLWLDTAADGIEPRLASDRLAAAGIRVNFMTGLPGFTGPGVRIGLNEPTYQGLSHDELPELADAFTGALFGTAPPEELAERTARLRDRLRPHAVAAGDRSPLTQAALTLAADVLTGSGVQAAAL
jgi:glycine hydroxymethyltransferase